MMKAIAGVIVAAYSLTPHFVISQPYSFAGEGGKQGAGRQEAGKGREPKGEELPESQRPITDADVVPGKALKKAQPKYPKEAKQARVGGEVGVKIVVDEKGRVIKADAVGGDALLHEAAEKAALKWRFVPTLLFGKPVKVSGFITFNFILE